MRIVESKFIKSSVKPDQYPASPYADYAFVGKSNVGKSSLINTILNRKAIAKVSGTPGKTRLINFFEIRFKNDKDENGFLNFVDLPGYGYAKVSKTDRELWKKMILKYFENRLNLNGIIVLVDIRHKADPKDIIVIEMLKKNNIKFVVAATKSDKIPKAKQLVTANKLADGLQINRDMIFPVSSLKKTGVNKIFNWIEKQVL
ncbi:ribosome biogenesis GTP-binding protein YihA/YsxC [Candidatus Cloacimonadota bacterium]